LARGKPLGGFEKWSQWARDPLLALGCQDPVERIILVCFHWFENDCNLYAALTAAAPFETSGDWPAKRIFGQKWLLPGNPLRWRGDRPQPGRAGTYLALGLRAWCVHVKFALRLDARLVSKVFDITGLFGAGCRSRTRDLLITK
jgi:hypothetical protein